MLRRTFCRVENVSYAMFAGGGVAWAEDQLKRGRYAIARAPLDSGPIFLGSIVVLVRYRQSRGLFSRLSQPRSEEHRPYAALVADVLALIEFSSDRSGHPLPEAGPMPTWLGGEIQRQIDKQSPQIQLSVHRG